MLPRPNTRKQRIADLDMRLFVGTEEPEMRIRFGAASGLPQGEREPVVCLTEGRFERYRLFEMLDRAIEHPGQVLNAGR